MLVVLPPSEKISAGADDDKHTGLLQLYDILDEEKSPVLSFTLPRDVGDGYVNNKKEVYKFK